MVKQSMASAGKPAIFLDRDGVLVIPTFRDGRSFAPTSLENFVIYPEARACLDRLKGAGFLLVVVTNQPDVGNGVVERAVVDEMHRRLRVALPLDSVKVCFHRQDENCACRKPKPYLLLEAAREMNIELSASVIIGDRVSDIEAGRSAGCRTIHIDWGYTAEPAPKDVDIVATSLTEATDRLLTPQREMATR
ncbi:D,D-heptose 1,7-bisphosphate phosphatase [Labrys miyagiensis]|uniref:D,D-heptose 1,7-bisphosphate phosphatase n=1 Tax=Labrys miyagiensis TaxID=346912 RepID=A0ABQ6CRE0_9HYPH|nr:HAD-IIIA family hydrolase [Labrys miyagiensis]GLS22700.1 D,D-heptose 1,7-bisphosphate phosphatase [Labrys miyagiensis]